MMETVPTWLPLDFEGWEPAMQGVMIGLLTFVQEDVPTVSAALLAVSGEIGWPTAYLGSFLGIWIGDLLLYLAARIAGPRILRGRWLRRVVTPAAITRAEQWFDRHGTWALLGSRMVPGTRLPTYLVAGFLKARFWHFFLITGIAVAVWTAAIFLLTTSLGAIIPGYIASSKRAGWLLLLFLGTFLLVFRGRRCLNARPLKRLGTFIGRWFRWEFWPAWIFYAPVLINYARLALKYRGWMLPTAANPGIFSGGITGESKIATLRDLSESAPEFTARAFLIHEAGHQERIETLDLLIQHHHIHYPFILKPDVGQRGVGVKTIRNREQAADHLHSTRAPVVVQDYASGPCEAGIFYYRFPGESKGQIFAITEKSFPRITGDGVRSIEELIWDDPRARFMAGKYLQRFHARRNEILPSGASLTLVEAGNHAQGCIFRDGAHLWSLELENRIDEISRRLDRFFIGRFDIRYACDDDLRAGRNFKIIELNGAASEATNIYDARNSIFYAYRTLFQQWELVFAIGAANRALGCATTPVEELWRAWRDSVARISTYPIPD